MASNGGFERCPSAAADLHRLFIADFGVPKLLHRQLNYESIEIWLVCIGLQELKWN